MRCRHDMPFGATLNRDGHAAWRLWAPSARSVELLLIVDHGEPLAVPADRFEGGWAEVRRNDVAGGQRYQWRIDGHLVVPDPASRWNPGGPHGPSVLIDPSTFAWDEGWRGRPWLDAVFCQLHIGTFTPQGSFDAAAEQLERLAALGITALQLMPLGDWPGRFGWGYDGVLPYAPFHGYGDPGALKRFVQTAHRLGLMVFGDVIYNHFGPDGNYLHAYARPFFTDRHRTAWGPAINYDGDQSRTVRDFVIHNALYWLEEFRFDGLRLDAVHAMRDDGPLHILEELSQRVRSTITDRQVHLVLENDANERRWLANKPTPGRYDGQWNGDVHHTLHVLLTGERDGYYAEYDDPVAQLGRSLAHGFAREGTPHNVEGGAPRRAAEGDAPLTAIVNLLQNHDQIGNRAFGDRLVTLADPAALQLAQAILLLSPTIPLLFMGEEHDATEPFQYFADWQGELRDAVRHGRQQEFAHFPSYAAAAASGRLPDPCSPETMARCRIRAVPAREALAALLHLRATALRPLLPRLATAGHAAQHLGPVLQLHWHFDAQDEQPARTLRMQANLSAHRLPAAAPPPHASLLHAIGETSGQHLGAWSGRWHWLERQPTT
jgi:1,4-alpha-glucan branching enzyme/maltooligosyltrehalose trehalohydrolase